MEWNISWKVLKKKKNCTNYRYLSQQQPIKVRGFGKFGRTPSWAGLKQRPPVCTILSRLNTLLYRGMSFLFIYFHSFKNRLVMPLINSPWRRILKHSVHNNNIGWILKVHFGRLHFTMSRERVLLTAVNMLFFDQIVL